MIRGALALFGVVLFGLSALLATVAPDVIARAAELEPSAARAGLAGYAMATLGGLALGVTMCVAALRSGR